MPDQGAPIQGLPIQQKKISNFLPRSTGLCVRLVLGLPNPYIPRHPTSHRKIATRGALLQPSRLSTGRPQSTATCPRRADSAKRATSLQPKTFRATVATRIAADSGLTTLAPRLGIPDQSKAPILARQNRIFQRHDQDRSRTRRQPHRLVEIDDAQAQSSRCPSAKSFAASLSHQQQPIDLPQPAPRHSS